MAPPKKRAAVSKKASRRGAKKRAASTPKKSATVVKKRSVTSKKRGATAPKKRATITSKKRAAAPKKRGAARSTVAPKKVSAARVPSPAQAAAVTRALRAFVELNAPRSHTRISQQLVFIERRNALVSALRNAGYSEASIRARLGWITRRRNTDRARNTLVRQRVLEEGIDDPIGRLLASSLHGKNPDDRRVLQNMYERSDPRYLRFLRELMALGVDEAEAINEWFSPKIKE